MLLSVLTSVVSGFAAALTLRFLPESWLRERWEAPVPRLSPSRRVPFLFAFTGAFAGLLLSTSESPWIGFSFSVSSSPAAGLSLPSVMTPLILFLLFQIAYVDFTRRVIPDQHLLLLALSGFICLLASAASAAENDVPSASPFFASLSSLFPKALVSAALSAFLTFLPALPELFGRRGILGLGDVKLFAVLGFLAGAVRPDDAPVPVLSLLVCAFLLNGLVAAALLLLRRTKRTDSLPMAPSICLALVLVLLR